jgi:3'-phosphoadenosine 5'-phosphosulfate sulfotransferase (PAPS reductase)/FAD synthetase
MNTGVELPETVAYCKTIDNIITLKPEKRFHRIVKEHGYPVASKEVANKIYLIRSGNTSIEVRKKWSYLIDAPFPISAGCCRFLKKQEFKKYERRTKNCGFLGSRAQEGRVRKQNYEKHGCNKYEGRPMSLPMSFWTQIDVWNYIVDNNLPYNKAYDLGFYRTGCMYCLFGIEHDGTPNRIQVLKVLHPKLWKYAMDILGLRAVMEYMNIPYDYDGTIPKFKPGGFKQTESMFY